MRQICVLSKGFLRDLMNGWWNTEQSELRLGWVHICEFGSSVKHGMKRDTFRVVQTLEVFTRREKSWKVTNPNNPSSDCSVFHQPFREAHRDLSPKYAVWYQTTPFLSPIPFPHILYFCNFKSVEQCAT